MFEPGNVLVGTESAVVVAANETRRGLFIRNMSSNKIYLGFCENDAELNKGFVLFPNESYSMTENDYCRGAINAISDVADSLVLFQEYTMDGRL
jgi:hypothetical protein